MKGQCMKKGHNRVGGVAVEQLKSIISRVEKLLDNRCSSRQALRGQ
jgi:uncharacterized protein (UPF0335 family)